MADDMQPHTKSDGLKRLLRRRGRRHKVGANTGEKIHSWAEYGRVNFTPSGDRSGLQYVFAGIGGLGALLVVPLIFALAGYDKAGRAIPLTPYLSELASGVIVIAILLMFFGLPVSAGLWLYSRLDGDGSKDRERLIAAADKLRETQAEAQDEAANHGN